MKEFDTDELSLSGRVQIETALGALIYTGLNPSAQQRLRTFLDLHEKLSDGETQDDLSVLLRGPKTKQEKADIKVSLDALKDSESATPEARLAAVALREIL